MSAPLEPKGLEAVLAQLRAARSSGAEPWQQEQQRRQQRKQLRLLLWQALKATDLPDAGGTPR
jgi:hypothetical protein